MWDSLGHSVDSLEMLGTWKMDNTVNRWNTRSSFKKKLDILLLSRKCTRQISHNALSADLQILIRKLKPGTRARWKTLAMQRDLGKEEHSNLCTLRHAPLCATPLTAGVGKEECLVFTSLQRAYFLRAPSMCSLWFVLSPMT
ncbi:1637_t:CDS:2 [Funneliformis mosseae]|uniref:1637_t:CDS:1 n=1 Tax=Funneliformis mosseae TaxID=27381 RepID=A0A9N9CX19_FUNMO|nr:1637_t:CDS:2 [Funneliformis mosseae]